MEMRADLLGLLDVLSLTPIEQLLKLVLVRVLHLGDILHTPTDDTLPFHVRLFLVLTQTEGRFELRLHLRFFEPGFHSNIVTDLCTFVKAPVQIKTALP